MPQVTLTRDKKRTIIKWCIAAGIPALMAALYYIFASRRTLSNFAVKYFSRPARDILGTVCSIFPFSIMEIIYAAAIIFLIVFIVRTVILAIRRSNKLRLVITRIAVLVLVVAYIASGYLWLWGIDYQADSFGDKEGFSTAPIATEDLYNAAKFFMFRAMEAADAVKRDENGVFCEEWSDYSPNALTVYDELEKVFPSLEATSRRPKPMVFSYIMSVMTFTGIYFPFTGESNINTHAPDAFIPVTVAHELAHQRGVYAEQECNFLGITACVTCDDPVYNYSGYLSGAAHLMNALWRADQDLWYELFGQISGGMLADWLYNSNYWRSFEETKVADVSEKVYDTYLKANGQELGMQSYGACVDYLVAYYLAGGFGE